VLLGYYYGLLCKGVAIGNTAAAVRFSELKLELISSNYSSENLTAQAAE
jgi:hypothetical protein